jgi:hypothetical protein
MKAPTDRQLERAGVAVRTTTEQRDELIRTAVLAGRPIREVGRLVGLTHTAIRYIITKDIPT